MLVKKKVGLVFVSQFLRNETAAQRESFRAGYPADIPGARTSRVKSFGQALESLEKQAFVCGHPWPERADVHDHRGFRQEKRAQRLTFGSRDRLEGWGSSMRSGGGQNFVLSLESLSFLDFEERNLGCPGILPGCPGLWGCSKSLCLTSSCAFFAFRGVPEKLRAEKLPADFSLPSFSDKVSETSGCVTSRPTKVWSASSSSLAW